MTTARNLEKAALTAINWQEDGSVTPYQDNQQNSNQDKPQQAHEVEVQFNPASLKVSYANQVQTNDQSSPAAMQFVGRGSSSLAVELIFDVSGEGATDTQDVRKMTDKIAFFMKTEENNSTGEETEQETRFTVPGVRFQWGSFLFDGIMTSLDETLELWSEDGYPLRATVSINLSQPGIHFEFNPNHEATPPPKRGKGSLPVGTKPLTLAPAGSTMQGMVANTGKKQDWKTIAALNSIENPRHLPTGTLLNLKPSALDLARLGASKAPTARSSEELKPFPKVHPNLSDQPFGPEILRPFV